MLRRAASLTAALCALTLTALAAGCAEGEATGSVPRNDITVAERQELDNLPTGAKIPFTRPGRLAASFAAYCVESPPDLAGRTALLREAGYVPAGGFRRGIRSFVSDDSRPMVQLSQSGRTCAVRAMARAGQTALLHRALPEWLPGARMISIDANGSEIWASDSAPAQRIAILRRPFSPDQNEISVALVRL